MAGKVELIRADPEMIKIINFIQIHYMKEGKVKPSAKIITNRIAKMINKEELLRNEFIRF